MIAGYEGSELLFARLMVEAGAKVGYVSTSVKGSAGTKDDVAWLEDKGIKVLFRKRHEDDLAALAEQPYDLVIGSSNLEAVAKKMGVPSVYYTNIVSSRPILLAGGGRPLVDQMKLLLSQTQTYRTMRDFFADVDTLHREAVQVGV